ncbi:FAD-dependent oxidoreductase [Danxiaibacter flavus]|uniref:Tryptophan 2-monooxygenase n=1 Tax=Danxiaibacter flavus TaxID=3049108 RepID=A0ABV3ZGW4_9BACT|nr:FAD-dependent oxidoreductase [Chitinophagaceae bacterium DXS]
MRKRRFDYDVIVVGAGAAGIACMKELVNRGYTNTICLEALNAVGGRVRFNNKFGDVGGMCLHLPEKLLRIQNLHEEFWGAADLISFARKNDFRFIRENEKPNFRLYKNGQRIKESLVNKANDAIETTIENTIKKIERRELPSDISLKDAFSKIFNDDLCRSLISTIYSNTDTGLDAEEISFMDYINTMPSNPGLFPQDGMGTLLKAYARSIRNYISFSKEVISVKSEKGSILVACRDSITNATFELSTKMLVITISVGVLKSWIKEKRIALPEEKVSVINSLQMGYLNKNILLMDELFFDENHISSFTHINIRSNRLNRDANFLALKMFGKHILINFVGGKKSLEYEKKGTAYARNASLKILASVFGKVVFDYCKDSYLSQWNKDKYFLGAYSAASRNNFQARLLLSQPLDKNIFKAGEEVLYHSDQMSYHTHISGALDSGFIVANQVIKELALEKS